MASPGDAPPLSAARGMLRHRTSLIAILLILVAAIVLWRELDQGWFPHDEGVLGQSAERVLAGEVPHRDFDETYTGLLTYVHAATFGVFGVTAMNLRYVLFAASLLWVFAMFRIATRFMPDWAAALLALTTFVWGVPNYPASLPSWYNLFCATFGVLALIKWDETGQRRWLAWAGLAGGISFLVKLSGIFYLFGAGLALVIASGRRDEDAAAERSPWAPVILGVALIGVVAVLARAIVPAGYPGLVRYITPLSILVAAIVVREWRARGPVAPRLRALWDSAWPFAAGALAPIILFAGAITLAGGLGPMIEGVLITPFRRLGSASFPPIAPTRLVYAFAFAYALAPRRDGWGSRIGAVCFAAVLALDFRYSTRSGLLYAIPFLIIWGSHVVAAVGAAALLLAPHSTARDRRMGTRAVMLVAVVLGIVLIEYPFAAPIYTLYVAPLAILALAAVVRAGAATPRAMQAIAVAFLLIFGSFRLLPGVVQLIGRRYNVSDELVRLDAPRARLRLPPLHADAYTQLLRLLEEVGPERTLWAGPDAPEVYFLSGMRNHTRTMFDFFDPPAVTDRPLPDRLRDLGTSLIVLKVSPPFSAQIDIATVQALRKEFPNERALPGFLVLWR